MQNTVRTNIPLLKFNTTLLRLDAFKYESPDLYGDRASVKT
jgi:hypothetical protein